MANVSLSHIYKVYPNGAKAVSDFNMEIEDKEFIVFVGPSGCGKSTTLRMIAGLEDITAGELKIGGEVVNDVEPKERDIAMVFQNYALYPHMTVYENMAFGLKIRKVPKDEIHRRILEAAEILDLTEYLDRKPKAMSGGQRQRVALGRAILRNPKVFLLDEPLSNLDAKLRTQMRAEILKLHKKLETTFIYVTHDQVEAMTMGTRIVVMKKGFVQQIDTPKNLYKFPANKFVAGFIGTPQMNFFDVTLELVGNDVKVRFIKTGDEVVVPYEKLIKVQPQYLDGKKTAILGIRCEFVSIDPSIVGKSNTVIKAKISHLEELGNETLVYGNININSSDFKDTDTRIIIKSFGDKEFENDQIVDVALDFNNVVLFDGETENSIMPRIPHENTINASIKDNKLVFLGNEVTLPNAMLRNDATGTLVIPTAALKIVDEKSIYSIEGVISKIEKINDKYLNFLKVGNDILFVLSDIEYKINDVVNVNIDMKELSFTSNEYCIEPFNTLNSLPMIFKKVKEVVEVRQNNGHTKKEKVINFKISIEGVDFASTDYVNEKIFSALKNDAFDSSYRIDFDASSVSFAENGIFAKLVEVIDYGTEKYAKYDIGDKCLVVLLKDKILQEAHLVIDFASIGLTETKIDMKLI